MTLTADPRKVGGVYRNSDWGLQYRVLQINGGCFSIQWEDGEKSTHCTPWNPKKDRAIWDGLGDAPKAVHYPLRKRA